MNIKYRKIIVPTLLLFLFVFGGFMYHRINSMYPNPMPISAKLNEEINYKEISIQVSGYKFISLAELKEQYSDVDFSYIAGDAVAVKLNLELNSDENTKLNLADFVLQNDLLAQAPDIAIAYEDIGQITVEIPAGECLTVPVSFIFQEQAFYESDWQKIREFKYTLEIVDTYPKRYMITLQ